MSGLIEIAAAAMKAAERNIAIISGNIANAQSPGFKRIQSHQSFSSYLGGNEVPPRQPRADLSQGTLKSTSNVLDLAIDGQGYFLVRQADRYFATRGGQFSVGLNQAVQNNDGMVLQLAGGGDLIVDGQQIEILADGVVVEDGVPIGTIGVFNTPNPSASGGPIASLDGISETAAELYNVRSGMLEASNVILTDEMTALMANIRQAEATAQLVRGYDQLMGQAVSTFGRGGR